MILLGCSAGAKICKICTNFFFDGAIPFYSNFLHNSLSMCFWSRTENVRLVSFLPEIHCILQYVKWQNMWLAPPSEPRFLVISFSRFYFSILPFCSSPLMKCKSQTLFTHWSFEFDNISFLKDNPIIISSSVLVV